MRFGLLWVWGVGFRVTVGLGGVGFEATMGLGLIWATVSISSISMEKKMETITIENQLDKNLENDMETAYSI